jgi:hypothetical protein
MPEETPLPLARMATINKPSFWVFIVTCIFLYVYNKFSSPDTGDISSYVLNGFFIFLAAFMALFLNLIAGEVKRQTVSRIFNAVCYIFEAGSLLILMIRIFLKW